MSSTVIKNSRVILLAFKPLYTTYKALILESIGKDEFKSRKEFNEEVKKHEIRVSVSEDLVSAVYKFGNLVIIDACPTCRRDNTSFFFLKNNQSEKRVLDLLKAV